MGKGYAIRTGLNYVTGDMVIIQDADLEYDPEDYKNLIIPIMAGKAKVVYGSRNLGRGKHEKSYFSFYIGGIFLSKMANFLYRLNITDEATCYKTFRTDVIKGINLKCKRFEFCPEITAKIAKKGIKILEIPISYHPRKKSEGKKINWKDGVEAIWTLIRYRFND
jgi:glycosyltransferase involved in cell wall biosynthesis